MKLGATFGIVTAAFTVYLANAALMPSALAGSHSVNRSVSVNANSELDDVSSVNGDVALTTGANAKDLSNVNGDIELGGNNTVQDITNVNGSIKTAKTLHVNGDISSVNGLIELGLDSRISGELSTVNGALNYAGGSVGKDISTVNGDVKLGAVTVQGNVSTTWGDVVLNGAAITGELRVKKPRVSNWWGKDPQPPRIVLGAGARIAGSITLEQPAKIYVHQNAQLPTITGEMVDGAVVRFTGGSAPR